MKRQTGLLTGSITNFISSILLFAARFGTSIIVARTLGAEGKGIYTLALTVGSLLVIATNLGFNGALTYLAAGKKFSLRQLFSFAILAVFGLSIAGGIIFYPLYTYWLAENFLSGLNRTLVIFVIAVLPVNLLVSFIISLLLGSQRLIALNSVEVIRVTTNLVLQVLSSIAGLGVLGAVGAWFLSALVALGLALYLLAMETSLWPVKPFQVIKPALNYGIKSYVANLTTFFNYRLDTFLVNYYAGPANLGLYSTAVGVAELLWYFPNSISSALFPKVSTLDPQVANRLTARTTRQALLMSVPSALLFGAAGVFLIPWVYSEQFRPSVTPFLFLLPGIISMVVGKIISADLNGRGKPQYATYTSLFTVFLTLALDILLIPRLGIAGAAIASSIAYITTSFIIVAFFHRETGVSWRQLLIPDRSDIAFIARRGKELIAQAARRIKQRARRAIHPTEGAGSPEPPVPGPVPQLRMVYTFQPGETIPQPAIPPGYRLVEYHPDLEPAWLNILNESGEFNPFTSQALWKEILSGLIPRGGVFIEREGNLVATAAVCYRPEAVPNAVLMYVVVLPEHRGLGLGKIVTYQVMEIARQAGYTGMILYTDEYRLPAIRMYLDLGFQPDFESHPGAREHWQRVLVREAKEVPGRGNSE